jgi:hypothetical protein
MEARRVSTDRRLSCARSVLARKRPGLDESANIARKLQRREIAAGPRCSFAASVTRERFSNIQLQVTGASFCILVLAYCTAVAVGRRNFST